MPISTLSKHLPLVYPYLGRPAGDTFLEFVHLVEAARYHNYCLHQAFSGHGYAPADFDSGTDMRGATLDEHWQIQVGVIEFEAFLTASKRALDRSWGAFLAALGPMAPNADTVGSAVNNLRKKVDDPKLLEFIETHNYYRSLRSHWRDWGKELTRMRNYVEHTAPFGGWNVGFVTVSGAERRVHLILPDEVPPKYKVPKKALEYTQNRLADDYADYVLDRLDHLVIDLHAAADVLLYE